MATERTTTQQDTIELLILLCPRLTDRDRLAQILALNRALQRRSLQSQRCIRRQEFELQELREQLRKCAMGNLCHGCVPTFRDSSVWKRIDPDL